MLAYLQSPILTYTGAGSSAPTFHHRRGTRRQAVPRATDVGALGRRVGECVRAAVGRGLRAGHAARALAAGPGLRGRGHAARCLRNHVGRIRSIH